MRVGKSGAVKCDHCAEVIVGPSDVVKIGDKERHFCAEASCMEEWCVERWRDSINKEVEKQVREEFTFLHRQVCPACRFRIMKATNKLFTRATPG